MSTIVDWMRCKSMRLVYKTNLMSTIVDKLIAPIDIIGL